MGDFANSNKAEAVFRILDASANRVGEGLRVVEDYVRFVLDDAGLTGEVKSLRHRLAGGVALLGRERLLAARDTAADVGVDVKEAAELHRKDAAEVATASLQRAEQALRSLGEFGKLVSPEAAAEFEAIRYAVYCLESRLAVRSARRLRIAAARLYVLVDGGASVKEFAARVEALLAGGADVIQLRDKRLTDRDLLERGRILRRNIALAGATTLFIMNDRADLAVLCDADGVHVGQEELAAADARRIVGPGRLVGVSTHDREQAAQAASDEVDYIGVGPTFPSSTKAFSSFPGLELSQYVAANLALPAFAIGGITLQNLSQVLASGIRRVAVGAAISQAVDVQSELGKWREALS
jgi:thiamine-phosphate pyrophosphorylase